MTTPKLAQQINSSQVGSVEISNQIAEILVEREDLRKQVSDLLTERDQLKQQLTDLTACLEWADKNVVPFRGVSRFGWLAWVKDTGYHGSTLLQALTTAYENRDKTI